MATRAVATDMSEIVHKVLHAGLLHLLNSNRFSSQVFRVILSFISNRRLSLCLDGKSLYWFQFLILMAGPIDILMGCMIYLSPFSNVIRISKSRVSFLTQPYSGIPCLQNAYL